MRYITASIGLIIFTVSHPAFADDIKQRTYGISFSNIFTSNISSPSLTIRKSISESSLIYAGIGLNKVDSSSGGYSNNYMGNKIILGARRYLTIDKLSDFIDVELDAIYSKSSSTNNLTQHSKGASGYAEYGIEYYIASNLSIEVKAGLSVNYMKITYGGTPQSTTTKQIIFPTTSTAVTYYW